MISFPKNTTCPTFSPKSCTLTIHTEKKRNDNIKVDIYCCVEREKSKRISCENCHFSIPVSQSVPISIPLQRKKSLPDVQELPKKTEMMSREEVSALGSARREEVRRQIENSERLRANPLLYLVSPQVKVSNFKSFICLLLIKKVAFLI